MTSELTIERRKQLRELHNDESWGEPHVLEVLDALEAAMQREAKLREALLDILTQIPKGPRTLEKIEDIAREALASEYREEIEKP